MKSQVKKPRAPRKPKEKKEELNNDAALLELVKDATDVKPITFEEYVLERFKEKLDLKRVAMLFVGHEREAIRKHIRLLKETDKMYVDLNIELAAAKSAQEVADILGDESEIVIQWKEYLSDGKS